MFKDLIKGALVGVIAWKGYDYLPDSVTSSTAGQYGGIAAIAGLALVVLNKVA